MGCYIQLLRKSGNKDITWNTIKLENCLFPPEMFAYIVEMLLFDLLLINHYKKSNESYVFYISK